jgi:hypothetical protein
VNGQQELEYFDSPQVEPLNYWGLN